MSFPLSLPRKLPFRPRRWSHMLCAALLLVFIIQLINVARTYSANWDEAHHLYDGYNVWTRHDYRLNAEVPPLVKLAAAMPLLEMHLQRPPDQGTGHTDNAFLSGRAFVFGNGGDRVLFPARMVCMLFPLLLAGLVYGVGYRLFGKLAGLAALSLFIFDPLVLAHGTLVSTDVASALFLFASVFAFYGYVRRRSFARLAIAGLLAGMAMTAKFTGILVVPVLVLLCVAEAVRLRSLRMLARHLGAVFGIGVIGWGIVWGLYGFRYAPAPDGQQLSPPLAPYLALLPNRADAAKLAFVARYKLLPEAYLWGLANTKKTEWEYTSYFFGRVYRHGPWQYFPAAFLIKSTLPLLLVLFLAPWFWRRMGPERGQKLLFLLVPVGVYFAMITSSHFDIGARHMMPVYPFLYLLAGAVLAAMLRGRTGWLLLACVFLAWQALTSLRVAPAYMAYGNEAWGGPLQVRRYLSDANVDWGQQLKTVKQYLAANDIHDCWFGYFPDGAVEPRDYGVACRRLPTPSALWWLKLPMDVPPVIDGTVLLSESVLDGVESGDGPLNPYAAFQQEKPVAILQDGVYVYRGRFNVPLASAWVDVHRSGERSRAGQPQAALALAYKAAQLAPDSARVQANLAGLLAAGGNWQEALDHYRLAQQWLKANRPELEEEELAPAIQAGLARCAAHPHTPREPVRP